MLSSPLVPASRSRDGGPVPAPPHDHVVQFYDSDDFLTERVADFIRDGLRNAEAVIVIATAEHRELFCRRLAADGFDLAQERALGRLTLLDAGETLATFMVEGMPDWQRFKQEMRLIIERCTAASSDARIRAYGEMVDLLWREGQPQAALRLEELWNVLAQTHSFSLLCGYVMSNFFREADAHQFGHVCDAHSHVLPTEEYSRDGDSDATMREIAALQQRARSLETEVAQRKQLEDGLREALAERRLVEEELRASRTELERQNEELSRTVRFSEMFVGILGHDLRNPLSAIVTAASLLTRRAEVEQVARPARRILSSAGRMARMIDQLLDFTRIRLGHGLPIQAKAVDLAHLCQGTLDELSGERRRVELSSAGNPIGEWDGDRLAQLVSNLVSNALTHGAADGRVQVRIDGSEASGVRLEVHNHGVIPQALLPGIFEPLHSSNDRKYEGSSGLGLGLYITRQIVQAHAGAIEVTSSESDGTRFVVDLPKTSASALAYESVNERHSASTKTVLIVEDEPDIRESLREVLEDEGYAVVVASNGREGLAQLMQLARPCAVVLDIIMPVMSGNELYTAMQADPELAKIPVLVSTSDPSRAPSGVLIMKKPIDVDRFLDAVAKLF